MLGAFRVLEQEKQTGHIQQLLYCKLLPAKSTSPLVSCVLVFSTEYLWGAHGQDPRAPIQAQLPWRARSRQTGSKVIVTGVTESTLQKKLASRAPTHFLRDYLWEQKLLLILREAAAEVTV